MSLQVTPRQLEAVRAIVGHRIVRGVYPTHRELGAQLGISYTRAAQLFDRLVTSGWILPGAFGCPRTYSLSALALSWVRGGMRGILR